MKAKEAAEVIDGIIQSLRDNPAQFNIAVNTSVAGAVGVGGPGGPGIVGVAQGGGVGFMGVASAPSQVQIDIAQGRAKEELTQEFERCLAVLEQIRDEILKKTPSKSRLEKLVDSLKEKWLPNVIAATVAQLIARVVAS